MAFDSFWLIVYFVWYKYSHPCSLVTICMKYPFTFSLCVSWNLKWVSLFSIYSKWNIIQHRQHIVESCFFNPFSPLWLLTGEFNTFTFKIIVDREELTIDILLLVFSVVAFLSLFYSFTIFLCVLQIFLFFFFSNMLWFPFLIFFWISSVVVFFVVTRGLT